MMPSAQMDQIEPELDSDGLKLDSHGLDRTKTSFKWTRWERKQAQMDQNWTQLTQTKPELDSDRLELVSDGLDWTQMYQMEPEPDSDGLRPELDSRGQDQKHWVEKPRHIWRMI